jgi:glycosyltransferase involved in cell wall biosynthesis
MKRILVVSKDIWPWAGVYGGAMRLGRVTRALAEMGSVDFFLLSAHGQPHPPPRESEFGRVHTVLQPLSARPFSYMRSSGYVTAADQISADKKQLMSGLPGWLRGSRYDVVWYNRERMWLTAHELFDGAAIVDVDDLEDVLLARWLEVGITITGEEHSPAGQASMQSDIRWWQETHQRVAREAVIVVSSECDKRRIKVPGSIVVPNSYELAEPLSALPYADTSRLTILLQGSLVWPPNEDAAMWLVNDIAPRIRKDVPDLRIVLAGLPSPQIEALARHPGVQVAGVVPSMTPYLRSARLVVVPLRVGSGTRIKILEAFASRVPVVSTTVGAEGLDAVSGVHLEIADTADEIADRCVRLLKDGTRRERMATAAHHLYETHFRPSLAAERIRQAVALALSNTGRSG